MIDISTIKFDPSTHLVPVIVQDARTNTVLMQAYMDREAVRKTMDTGKVTFYSRSKKRLWTKGETSENFLDLVDILADCDRDSLLVKANPRGPTCHTGSDTCWNEVNGYSNIEFLIRLSEIIHKRRIHPKAESYTSKLFSTGINKVAQKLGEEAVELVIEAKDENADLFLNEAADLMYHYLVLLEMKGFSLEDVCSVLAERHK
jgi:phosphoribosyl-ATP pyrophosphohydrolase/phosphoribosyl-AMP cyclohydrolase